VIGQLHVPFNLTAGKISLIFIICEAGRSPEHSGCYR